MSSLSSKGAQVEVMLQAGQIFTFLTMTPAAVTALTLIAAHPATDANATLM